MPEIDATSITIEKVGTVKKTFPIRSVLGLLTGRWTKEDRDGAFRLMDFFFPGIFTLSALMMMPTARAHILKTYPFLGKVPELPRENFEEALYQECRKLPAFLEFEGPLEVSAKERQALADRLVDKVKKDRG